MRKGKLFFVLSLIFAGIAFKYFSLVASGDGINLGKVIIPVYFDCIDQKLKESYIKVGYNTEDTQYKIQDSSHDLAKVILTSEENIEKYEEQGYKVEQVGSYIYVAKFNTNTVSTGWGNSDFEVIGTSDKYYVRFNLSQFMRALSGKEAVKPGVFSADTFPYSVNTKDDLKFSKEEDIKLIIPNTSSEYRRHTIDTLLYNILDGKSASDWIATDKDEFLERIGIVNNVLAKSYASNNIRSDYYNTSGSCSIIPEIFLDKDNYRQYTEYTSAEVIYACYKEDGNTDNKSIQTFINALQHSKKLTDKYEVRNREVSSIAYWCTNPRILDYKDDFVAVFGQDYWKNDVITANTTIGTGGNLSAGTNNS